MNAHRADIEARKAEQNAAEATRNAQEARRQRREAENNATEAVRQRRQAEQSAAEADRQRNVAIARQLAAQSQLVEAEGLQHTQLAALLGVESLRYAVNGSDLDLNRTFEADRAVRRTAFLLAAPEKTIHYRRAVRWATFVTGTHQLLTLHGGGSFSPDTSLSIRNVNEVGSVEQTIFQGTPTVWPSDSGRCFVTQSNPHASQAPSSQSSQSILEAPSGPPDSTHNVVTRNHRNEDHGRAIALAQWPDYREKLRWDSPFDIVGAIVADDCEHAALVEAGGRQHLVRIGDGTILASWQGAHNVARLAISPNGAFVASASGNVVQVFDTQNKKEVHLDRSLSGAAYALAFSPDSRFMAAANSLGSVTLFSTLSGKALPQSFHDRTREDGFPRNSFEPNIEQVSVAFSPSGRFFATLRSDIAQPAVARVFLSRMRKKGAWQLPDKA